MFFLITAAQFFQFCSEVQTEKMIKFVVIFALFIYVTRAAYDQRCPRFEPYSDEETDTIKVVENFDDPSKYLVCGYNKDLICEFNYLKIKFFL